MNPTNPVQLSPNLKPGAQPDPTQPEFGPWGPNPNLDPGGPTRPKNEFKLGPFGFIKYIIGLDPNLNPIRVKSDQFRPFFLTLRANSNPNFGSEIRFNPKKRVWFGRTTQDQKD